MKTCHLFAAVLAGTMTMAGGAAFAQDAETVVATVNDTPITLGQMIAMKQGMKDDPMAKLPDQALWDMMIDQLIRQTAVAAKGETDLNARDRALLELQRRAYLSSAAMEKVAAVEPTEEEIAATYEKAFGGQAAQTQYSAAHILVETENEAKALKKQLDEGGDFAALAREKSKDEASGPNDGGLGWFAADQMVAPFAEAVKAMEKGAVSDPVKTDFGWHIIRLDDTRTVQPPALEEVREQVVTQVRRDKVEAEVQRLTDEAKVEKTEGIDPALLNSADLLEVK